MQMISDLFSKIILQSDIFIPQLGPTQDASLTPERMDAQTGRQDGTQNAFLCSFFSF